MNHKFITSIFLFGSVFLPASQAFAEDKRNLAPNKQEEKQEKECFGKRRGKWQNTEEMKEKMLEDLNLTAEQKEQVSALFKSSKEQMKQDRGALRTERKALMELVHSGNASDEDILKQYRVVSEQGEKLALRRAAKFRELNKILRPEQKEALKEKKAAFAAKHGKRWNERLDKE